jgi:tRNA nucleotidyltransferase (CCA-adding enzyme)
VRVLHSLSFIDDPTRMVRAVRYEQRYGFEIEMRTLQLMDEAGPLLARLSNERIRHELDLILGEQNAPAMLARLNDLGLLKAISERLPWNNSLSGRLESAILSSPPPAWDLHNDIHGRFPVELLLYCLWLMDLPAAVIDTLQSQLSFSVIAFRTIQSSAALMADLANYSGMKPSQWVDRLDGVPLLAIYAVFLASGEPALETYATLWRNIHPQTTGETLKARGLKPGPAFRTLLHTLRSALLDGELGLGADETSFVEELLKEFPF